MKRVLFFVAGCFILSISACTQSDKTESAKEVSENTDNKQEEKEAEEAVADPNAIYLEGLYTTSTQLPQNDYAIENIFDNDPATYWTTMKGAGPDEGFMIYFKDETFIKEIKLKEAAKPGLSDIKTIAVYANGSSHGVFDIDKPVAVNKKLKSLYVRIKEVDNITNKSNEDDPMLNVEVFNEQLSVAISGIEITGENDVVYKIVPPKKVEGTVEASSVLAPQIAYHPSQLFDSKKEFVWAEGAAGAGENEILTFKFDEKVKMDGIKIWNGFQRSDKHYSANARIKSFEFGVKGSTSIYNVEDVQIPQEIKLKQAIEGNEFVFIIKEVYPGSSYKDAVISELRFIDKNTSFVIRNRDREKNIQTLEEKAKGTILENILDRRIKNTVESEYSDSEHSLILRSDYTFVLYEMDNGEGDSKEVIGDGSWEIIEMKDGKAKIRVFGKLLDLSQTFNEYKGSSSSTYTYLRIFQDFVYIDNYSVKGEKFVHPFVTAFSGQN